MIKRASIVSAAVTDVGRVREHNEDAYFTDADRGVFVVCDGMGGHAAGEVASGIAVKTVKKNWASPAVEQASEMWMKTGSVKARRLLLAAIREGALAAHDAIVTEATRDASKHGMGTTLVGVVVVGSDVVITHAGDSRAYLVRRGIAMQLTEDHTLIARLEAAGVEVDMQGEGAQWKSMLTNALGVGEIHQGRVSTYMLPLLDGDRLLLCSDGVTEYVKEAEIGQVLTTQASPARSAQRLVDLALDRGGHDNATAVVLRVLEAGESPRAENELKQEEEVASRCALFTKLTAQRRIRALHIGLPRDLVPGDVVPAQALGSRVAWIILDGALVRGPKTYGPGSLLYPQSLVAERPPIDDKEMLAIATSEVHALVIRYDDFQELVDDDVEVGELLLEALAFAVAADPVNLRPRPADNSDFAHSSTLEARALPAEDVASIKAEPASATGPKSPDVPPVVAPTKAPIPRASAANLATAAREALAMNGEIASNNPAPANAVADDDDEPLERTLIVAMPSKETSGIDDDIDELDEDAMLEIIIEPKQD